MKTASMTFPSLASFRRDEPVSIDAQNNLSITEIPEAKQHETNASLAVFPSTLRFPVLHITVTRFHTYPIL